MTKSGTQLKCCAGFVFEWPELASAKLFFTQFYIMDLLNEVFEFCHSNLSKLKV
jgi:hypothetical protein